MEIHQRAWVLESLINHRPLKWKKVMLVEEGQVLIYFDLYLGRHGLHSAHLQSLPKSYWGTKTGRLHISFIMMMMIFWSCSSSVPAPAPAPPSSLSDSTWFILILIPIFLLDYQSKVTRDKLDFGHTKPFAQAIFWPQNLRDFYEIVLWNLGGPGCQSNINPSTPEPWNHLLTGRACRIEVTKTIWWLDAIGIFHVFFFGSIIDLDGKDGHKSATPVEQSDFQRIKLQPAEWCDSLIPMLFTQRFRFEQHTPFHVLVEHDFFHLPNNVWQYWIKWHFCDCTFMVSWSIAIWQKCDFPCPNSPTTY